MHGPLNPIQIVSLQKRENLDTDTHTCEEAKGKTQGDVSTSQGSTRIASKLPEARGEPWNRFLPTALSGTSPADILILYFQLPEQ